MSYQRRIGHVIGGGLREKLRHQRFADHPVMRIGQAQRAVCGVGICQAVVGGGDVRAGDQPHRPGLRAFRQHLGDRPVGALAVAVAQIDGKIARELDVGPRRNDGADAEHDDVALQNAIEITVRHKRLIWQCHALGPDQRSQAGGARQQASGIEDHACGQRHGRSQARARSIGHGAVGMADRGSQNSVGGDDGVRSQGAGHGQTRARSHLHRGDGQIVVQDGTGGEFGAGLQFNADPRNDHVAIEHLLAGGQYPADIVRRLRRLGEAVIDTAVDIEIAAGAQRQRAHLARPGHAGELGVRIEAGIAMTGQIEIALHHEIAVERPADHLDARAQMEDVAIGRIVESTELAGRQRAAGDRRVHEIVALGMPGVEPGLVDKLIRPAVSRRSRSIRRIVIAADRIDRDRTRALDSQRAADIDVDVAVGDGINVSDQAIAADPRRVELERAAGAAVVLARCSTDRRVGAVPQIDARALCQRQPALARTQFHDGAIRAVDDFAVAVDAQRRTVGVEHRGPGQRQALLGRKPDGADRRAAGINGADYGELAAIQRDVDFAGLQFAADDEIALLELEAASAEHLSGIEAAVERGELVAERACAEPLRAHAHRAVAIRHIGAAGVIQSAGRPEDPALQIDHAGCRVQRRRRQAAGIVVGGRQVDHRTGRLADRTFAALQRDVAAPTVLLDVGERDLAAGDIKARGIGQGEIAQRAQRELAARHRDIAVEHDRVAVQRQFGAKRIGRHRDRSRRGACGGHVDRAARSYAVDRTGLAGEQRRGDVEIAASI